MPSLMSALRRTADNARDDSFATHHRRKRFALFLRLIERLPRPVRILDIGGTQLFWQTMRFGENDSVHITLLNLSAPRTTWRNVTSVAADARDLGMYPDGAFDVVFSNSVIEHVGGPEDQRRMAHEVRRVGRAYFVQTPNRYFPVEPHFLVPCFQFLPISVRVYLVRHLDLGWIGRGNRIADRATARELVTEIRLLNARELRGLFPDATIYRERVFGLTKSFVAYRAAAEASRGS